MPVGNVGGKSGVMLARAGVGDDGASLRFADLLHLAVVEVRLRCVVTVAGEGTEAVACIPCALRKVGKRSDYACVKGDALKVFEGGSVSADLVPRVYKHKLPRVRVNVGQPVVGGFGCFFRSLSLFGGRGRRSGVGCRTGGKPETQREQKEQKNKLFHGFTSQFAVHFILSSRRKHKRRRAPPGLQSPRRCRGDGVSRPR